MLNCQLGHGWCNDNSTIFSYRIWFGAGWDFLLVGRLLLDRDLGYMMTKHLQQSHERVQGCLLHIVAVSCWIEFRTFNAPQTQRNSFRARITCCCSYSVLPVPCSAFDFIRSRTFLLGRLGPDGRMIDLWPLWTIFSGKSPLTRCPAPLIRCTLWGNVVLSSWRTQATTEAKVSKADRNHKQEDSLVILHLATISLWDSIEAFRLQQRDLNHLPSRCFY